jgi:hypothetical protein
MERVPHSLQTQNAGQDFSQEGLYRIEAEFTTQHFVIRGEITSPDMRLSDNLNGSAGTVEIRPTYAQRTPSGAHIDLPDAHAHVTKAHLLFCVPISEPDRPPKADNVAWTWTMTRRAWAGLGRYTLAGKVHADSIRDPRLILRALDHRQFFPFTEATLTSPDGTVRTYDTVIVCRMSLEVLALGNS